MVSQLSARRSSAKASKPTVCSAMNSTSSTRSRAAREGRVVQFDHALGDALDQREIAAHLRADEHGTDLRAAHGQHFNRMLRAREAFETAFLQRIDRHDGRAALRALAQFAEHARMVGRRILAEDQQRVGVFEIVQRDRALADADRMRQAAAGRFVAHVRAVGEVVGAVHAHEQLVQERGFVAGAARRVEGGAVGIVEALQVVARSARTPRPSRSARSGRARRRRRSGRSGGRAVRARSPTAPSAPQRVCSSKNAGVTRLLVASAATALTPFSQNSKVDACSRSGHAQPGQSKPSGWFCLNSVR